MNRKVIFLLGIILSGGVMLAQEDQAVFSLEEAMDHALQHNKLLINASRDVDLAHQQYKEALGAGLPQVKGTIDYSTNFNYELELFGTVILFEDQTSANLQVTQLFFSGEYWVGLQLTKLGRKIAEQNMQSTELDIKENVLNSYYLVLVNERLIQIIEENITDLESVFKHTQNMYRVGMMEQTDADQVRITLSQLENTKKSMERSLQSTYNMFRFLLGIEPEQEVVLTDDLNMLTADIEEDRLWEMEFDPSVNPGFQILMTQEKMGEENLNMKRWAYAPTLAGYYTYKEKFTTTSFDMSPKNAAGLSLSVPIFAGGSKRARLSQAKIELDKINRNKSMVEDQLLLQNNQLSFELQSAYENYSTQKENVEVAKRVYENIHNKYKQGMVSSLDLTQANTGYLQAENNYVSALLNVLQSKVKLNKLYNKL